MLQSRRNVQPAPATRAHRRSRSNVELRILIYFKAAGAIIGKGGENIRQFRDMEHIEDISVPDRRSPERIVTISGRHTEAVVNCLQAMLDKLDEANAKYMGIEDTEVRMLIHASQVGAVIGRGGSRVKEMKHQKQVETLLLPHNCPMSNERVVLLSGTQENVAQCVGQIINVCLKIPRRGPYQAYDCANSDARFVDHYGGFVEIASPVPSPPTYPPSRAPLSRKMSDGYGAPPQGVLHVNNFVPNVPAVTPDYAMMPMMFPVPPMPMYGHGNKENQVLQIPVPLKQAEAVIGKGGHRIRNIRAESGAAISMLPQGSLDAAGNHRIFEIRGSSGQIQMAQKLIRDSNRRSRDY